MKLPKNKKEKKKDTEKTFLLTDGCVWEMNKQNKSDNPHAIEVVDAESGQIRYIRGGAIIKFISGMITEGRNQNDYNTGFEGIAYQEEKVSLPLTKKTKKK